MIKPDYIWCQVPIQHATKGSKNVTIINSDDKRQITAIIASTPSGYLLPAQLIFQGKTAQCHPNSTPDIIRNGFHMTHSENHWSSQLTEYIKYIVDPFVQSIIKKKSLEILRKGSKSDNCLRLLECSQIR